MSGLLRPRQPGLRRAGARGPDRRPGHGYGPAVRPLAGLAACGPAGRGRAQLCCAGGACALPRAYRPKSRAFPRRCFPAGETRRARRARQNALLTTRFHPAVYDHSAAQNIVLRCNQKVFAPLFSKSGKTRIFHFRKGALL